ncbi:hypothetical protein JK364_52080 [Streptomyces sp. 110]|uniref:XRE family transcriptional regulator n=1 Tax=Streptomyces endocoffeicus TaxID=2898945 RepID=A0ABS1Q8S0_9ACTN|nr:hypothetical protein [Streptomyces endocoffeicus]MBL1120744.1 hypothetical protein [Streptomyces endocoffeicus]
MGLQAPLPERAGDPREAPGRCVDEDLLIKFRGQTTRKQVAEVAGVRPVRLKELEECLKHPEGLETLGKVLRVYCVRPGVAMSTRQ